MSPRLSLSPPGAESAPSNAQALTDTVAGPSVGPPSHASPGPARNPSSPPRLARTRARSVPRRRLPLGGVAALVPGILVLLLWQILVQVGGVPAFFLPAPADVFRTFWTDFITSAWGAQSLLGFVWSTLVSSLAGFALGTVVALPLGYGVARSQWFARAAQPYIAASQALPAVALAPLLALWLPYGQPPVIVLCALIVFFPMVVNTVVGLRTLDREVLDAARVDGAGRWELLRAIETPLALPTVLAGMRTSLTLSITGAVVGEFVSGDLGLGGLLMIAHGNNDAALVFATLLVLGLLAAAYYGVARLAERLFSYLEAE